MNVGGVNTITARMYIDRKKEQYNIYIARRTSGWTADDSTAIS